MSIYNVDKLVEDARRKFARCVSAEELPLREVWESLDRYIFACMEQNHGLVVPNFGRFGWQVAHRFRNNCVGPYFDFLDSFRRRYRVSISRRQAPALEVDLCRWEDFNFSKAALCFSRKLTKDHVSVGLGVLVYQIGQAIAQGRPLSLDFRVGKLVVKERNVCRFLFSSEMMEMMEASPRMTRPSKVMDSSPPRPVQKGTSEIEPSRPSTSDASPRVVDCNLQRPHTSNMTPISVAKRPVRPRTSDVTSPRPLLCKRGQQAFHQEPESSPRCNNIKECLDQRMAMHIKELEQRAIRALGKRQDEKKMKEKNEELEKRRQRLQRLREHSDFLMKQMEDKEIRRKAEAAERESVVTASTHSTPRKPRKAGVSEHRRDLLTSLEQEDCASQLTEELAQDQLLAGRPRPAVLLGRLKAREELRDCLHTQIEVRRKQRQEQERERLEMEVSLLQQESHFMEVESSMQKAAKREEQESLKEAWSQECKLRDVHRRIEALEDGRVPTGPMGPTGPKAPLL